MQKRQFNKSGSFSVGSSRSRTSKQGNFINETIAVPEIEPNLHVPHLSGEENDKMFFLREEEGSHSLVATIDLENNSIESASAVSKDTLVKYCRENDLMKCLKVLIAGEL